MPADGGRVPPPPATAGGVAAGNVTTDGQRRTGAGLRQPTPAAIGGKPNHGGNRKHNPNAGDIRGQRTNSGGKVIRNAPRANGSIIPRNGVPVRGGRLETTAATGNASRPYQRGRADSIHGRTDSERNAKRQTRQRGRRAAYPHKTNAATRAAGYAERNNVCGGKCPRRAGTGFDSIPRDARRVWRG